MAKTTTYIVHVSSAEGPWEIESAREAGRDVFAETCPHYRLLPSDDVRRPDFEGGKYVLTPPLRE